MIKTIQLDAFAAIQERDKGMEVAVRHADAVIEGWSEKAYTLLIDFLDNHYGSFMAEEVRSYAVVKDFPLPPHARAWGSIIARASKSGLITRIGIKSVSNVKAHRANASVWLKI